MVLVDERSHSRVFFGHLKNTIFQMVTVHLMEIFVFSDTQHQNTKQNTKVHFIHLHSPC